jgi:hypothetical protein
MLRVKLLLTTILVYALFSFILNFLTTSILSEIVLIEGRIVLKCIKKEIKSYQKRRVIVYNYIMATSFSGGRSRNTRREPWASNW